MPGSADLPVGNALAALLTAALLMIVAIALTGCEPAGSRAGPQTPGTVFVPVATGCVAGVRPAAPRPLRESIPTGEWGKLSPKQKAAHVSAQALRHLNWGEELEASTAACR